MKTVMGLINLNEDSSLIRNLADRRAVESIPFAGRYRIVRIRFSFRCHADCVLAGILAGCAAQAVRWFDTLLRLAGYLRRQLRIGRCVVVVDLLLIVRCDRQCLRIDCQSAGNKFEFYLVTVIAALEQTCILRDIILIECNTVIFSIFLLRNYIFILLFFQVIYKNMLQFTAYNKIYRVVLNS